MRTLSVCAAIALYCLAPITAAADFALTLLHTNDFHARFEPINKYDSTCSVDDETKGLCLGGSARLATAIKQARARSDNSLLVDGGDQFQGSLFYTHYKGKVAAELMNTLGYDAMTVGNHEFDDGPAVLRTFMDNIRFPILMSNADITREPALADKLPGSVIIQRSGTNIGLIGLTPQDNHDLTSPGQNVIFTDPVTATQQEVDKLKAKGVNIIVVLSHSGFDIDHRVAQAVSDIDVIVGGHSNTLLSNTHENASGPYPLMVGTTAIVQAYAYGKYLGELDLVFDDNGTIVKATGDTRLLDASIEPDPTIAKRVAELAEPLNEIRQTIVANSASAVNGNAAVCRVQECTMGNLVADAMLDRVADQGIRIAIQNAGGIRASIDAGDITMGEVLSVLPFQNTLATFQLSGQDVIAALENGVSQAEAGKGRFPQVAGLTFTWNPAGDANKNRIKDVQVRAVDNIDAWEPIDPNVTYGVVSNNFMRSGGDGYRVFADKAKNAYDYGPGLESVVADYLMAHSPYEPYLDGRIKSVSSSE